VSRTMGTRVVLVAAAAAMVAGALTGCGVGQIAETAVKNPSVGGAQGTSADGLVYIRNMAVTFPGVDGYPAGASAPIEVTLFNESSQPVTVTITSQPSSQPGIVAGSAVNLVGPAPTVTSTGIPASAQPGGNRPPARKLPTGQAQPSATTGAPGAAATTAPPATGAPTAAAAGQPARIQIPALGYVDFRAGRTPSLQVVGLNAALLPGNAVNLIFTFSTGAAQLVLPAPVAVPLSPAPRAPGNPAEDTED
jgi:hypothetical protein